MKAKELMIGDWVSIDEPDRYAGATGQILSLFSHNEDEGAYFTVFIQGKMGFLHKEVCNMDIRPIPLTPELLEKNGFVKDTLQGVYVFCTEEYRILWPTDNNKTLAINSYFAEHGLLSKQHIDYVHQLQHALRLCGINKEIKL